MGYLDSLIQSESGGNWGAQNSEMGAGGKAGHFGRVQFGQARLQDAMNAGAIPQGVTPQQFMASPELQVAAENWHFADLEKNLGPLVGSVVNGRALDMGSLVAMGHLGGAGGARKYVQTGGRYNPSDSFGTSLSDYAGAHGGQSRGAPQGGALGPQGGSSTMAGTQGADTMEQPGGLLGRFKPAEENVGGLLGMIFKNMSPDRADSIRAGLAGMQGVNNQGVYNAAMGRMDGRRASAAGDTQFGRDTALQQQRIDADSAKRQAEQQRAAQMRAQARGWIEQNSPQHLGAFDGGAISVEQVYKAANPEPVKPTSDMQEYEFARSQGYRGSLQDWQNSGASAAAPNISTTVNTGEQPDSRPMADKPSKDFQRRWDAELGTWVDELIPGSGAATESRALEQKGLETERQSGIKMGTTLRSLDLNIKELEDGGVPVTGVIGAMGAKIPGSQASDFNNRTQQIQTRAALDEVQNMRDNSPTGGAVGQLTDSEREAIGIAATSMSSYTSKTEYLRAARKFREVMLDTAYGQGTWALDDDGQVKFGDRPAIGKTSPQRFKFNPETGAIE